ncbi:hypothetical protein OU995_11760 [Roseateles sp. SL47]|uniref:hypothetical protein n=1 Tax=Roseateles sp. SL47 TaxID=2995138 RepID=UPI00226F59DF|nr:hypothetical protein [Roseateles sp. SL47]WAC75324.1 hypothetical protein OU995_11760 [Roseateles sp. SL47]
MSRNLAYYLAGVATMIVVACGGGGGGGEANPTTSSPGQVPTTTATSLLVIGNSITRHGPLPAFNWFGDWGMAASSQDKDFAHLVGTGLGLPVTAMNVADIERDPSAPLPVFPVYPTTFVIVELGDNGLPAHYDKVMQAVKGSARLICTSTWWEKPDRDAVMRPLCEGVGGTWVYIGDIYKGPTGAWTAEAVAMHPQNDDMAEIARRVLVAAKGK